jgi:hypothetical protein
MVGLYAPRKRRTDKAHLPGESLRGDASTPTDVKKAQRRRGSFRDGKAFNAALEAIFGPKTRVLPKPLRVLPLPIYDRIRSASFLLYWFE